MRTRIPPPPHRVRRGRSSPPDRPHFLAMGDGAQSWLRVAVFAFLALGGLFSSIDARAATPEESFVQSEIDRSYAVLNNRALNAAERQRQFRAALLSVVDSKRVALFTLGSFARESPQANLDEFSAAFANFLTAVYQQSLEHYKNQIVKVTGSTARSDNDVIVNAVVASSGGQSPQLHIAFRVRRSGGEDVITDLQVEGAWLALSERADFMSYLQQHGGNVALLSSELQSRAERIRAALSKTDTSS